MSISLWVSKFRFFNLFRLHLQCWVKTNLSLFLVFSFWVCGLVYLNLRDLLDDWSFSINEIDIKYLYVSNATVRSRYGTSHYACLTTWTANMSLMWGAGDRNWSVMNDEIWLMLPDWLQGLLVRLLRGKTCCHYWVEQVFLCVKVKLTTSVLIKATIMRSILIPVGVVLSTGTSGASLFICLHLILTERVVEYALTVVLFLV